MRFAAFVAFFLCRCLLAQPEAKPEFEAVSLKLSSPDPRGYTVGCNGGPGTNDPGIFRCQNMSLSNLLVRAYGIPYNRVMGPDWLRTQMFEIQAKVPQGTTPDHFKIMLQNMLESRFGLKQHTESREMPIYRLVAMKGGAKFKPSGEAPDGGAQRADELERQGYPAMKPDQFGMSMANGRGRMQQKKYTMEMLAAFLSSQSGRPVRDATNLTGEFQLALYWISDSRAEAEPEAGPTLLQAVQDQLGLRLESAKGPVDVLVVDHCEKLPTEN
jgi:uncharacterized protein (TIGR03435 family)